MSKPGRNDVCFCGSGLKFKRCCLIKAAACPFTREDRASALAKLRDLATGPLAEEYDLAFEWFQDHKDDGTEALPAAWDQLSEPVINMWFWFDWTLDTEERVVDRLLATDSSLASGERAYLELCGRTCMRLYEVIDVHPGKSIMLTDVLTSSQLTVHEKTGSRQVRRADLLAARIIPRGPSGEPEIEAGLLNIPALIRQSTVEQLKSHYDEFRGLSKDLEEIHFHRDMAPFFHAAWASCIVQPPMPDLQNTDGDDLLLTRVHLQVQNVARLTAKLDSSKELRRSGDDLEWHWTGSNRSGESVSLGVFKLNGDTLVIETNSRERAERGQAMVEALLPNAVQHKATLHEDMAQLLRSRRDHSGVAATAVPSANAIPPDLAEALILGHFARHYREWVDHPLPALEGKTPRVAAKSAALRPKLTELIRGLEGQYEGALKRKEPAYDPSWMWAELGLEGTKVLHPPPLAHERWSAATPGFAEVCQGLSENLRAAATFNDVTSVLSSVEFAADLSVRRFLNELREAAGSAKGNTTTKIWAERPLFVSANHELHRRKTFWVDESLAYLLAHTDIGVHGGELRLPFPSLALVFTDRLTLSLAERHLAMHTNCPLAGHRLRVATVYLTETSEVEGRTIHIGLAVDTLGADLPFLFEQTLSLSENVPVAVPGLETQPSITAKTKDIAAPRPRPLPGLLQIVVNAILYASSSEVEPVTRAPVKAKTPRFGSAHAVHSSDSVFFLPGHITIKQLRQMQELERAPGGGQLLHRFMVRGHWRRPPKKWKEQRLRWIEPHWKGPDIAAVIERTYALKT